MENNFFFFRKVARNVVKREYLESAVFEKESDIIVFSLSAPAYCALFPLFAILYAFSSLLVNPCFLSPSFPSTLLR